MAHWAAAESMILLRNDQRTLPLAPSLTLALYGNASYNLIASGTGSGDVNKAYVVSLTDGLAVAGYSIDARLKAAYARQQKAKRPKPPLPFFPSLPIPEMTVDDPRGAAERVDVLDTRSSLINA